MSSTFESSKLLAAIGSILLVIPSVNIIGIILVLIGMKGLAEHYKDDSIYRKALKGVIVGIIGFVALTIAILGSVGLFSIFNTRSVYTGLYGTTSSYGTSYVGTFILLLLLLVILFVCILLMALYFRKALSALAERSGEHLFNTAGTLLLVGAALTIILVGLILVWIAFIILIVAFFSLKSGTNTQSYNYAPPSPTTPTTANTESKYCSYCGSPVSPGATFCAHCGKQI